MSLSPIESTVTRLAEQSSQSLLDDLRLHVGLPTGGRNVAALDETRERFVARARALGASVELIAGEPRPEWLFGEKPGQVPLPTVVCRRTIPGAGVEVLLSGHLDTVHDPAGSFRELVVDSSGRRATGPGCVDMKGGLVIAMAALEILDESGVKLSWTLVLNSDEETGSYHSFKAIFNESRRVASAGGVGLALEPATSDGGLVIERAGSGQFQITCHGKAAHVGRDFSSGISAVLELCKVVPKAAALAQSMENTVVNIGPLSGGSATNVVPDIARAWGNVRFATPEVGAAIERRLMELEHDGVPSVSVRTSFARPAKPLTPGVQRLADTVKRAAEDLGQPLAFTKTAGVCDGNIMQHAGLVTLDTLGVRGGGLHTPQEWIELDSLVDRTKLLMVTMMRASGLAGGE